MNTLWHFFKYNLIFGKVRLAFLSVLSLVVFGLSYYFYDNQKELGEALIQYSAYIIFMIFTGKMNAKNNLMFDIKHLMALPISKREIVFLKSIADIVHFMPIGLVFLYGVFLSFPEYHILPIGFIFLCVLTLANIISFNKRIDFFRMQHSKASFKNSFLYLHKYMEMMIQIILTVIVIAFVFIAFKKSIMLQEYAFVVLSIVAIFFAFSQTLKMLKDETLSYFILKRDVFRIGWKSVLVVVPLIGFHFLMKKDFNGNRTNVGSNLASFIKENKQYVNQAGNKAFLLTMVQNNEESFLKHLGEGKEIPWDSEVMGSYPPHLAVLSGNKKMIEKIIEIKPDQVNREGKFKKKTPLFSALRVCNLEMVDLLVKNGANINHQDVEGNTPLMYAAQKKCHGGVMFLKQVGADTTIKNQKGKTVFNLISKKSGMAYLLKADSKAIRELASEEVKPKKKGPKEALKKSISK